MPWRAGYPGMIRIWYFTAFIAVTAAMFWLLVGFDKFLDG